MIRIPTLPLAALALLLVGCNQGGGPSRRASAAAAVTTFRQPTSGPPGAAIVEDFTSTAQEDAALTTADWGGVSPGVLRARDPGAGDGSAGVFAPTADVTLTTGAGPLAYARVHIPAGVTVRATGPDPLVILCRGEFVLEGVIDVSGADGEHGQALGTPGRGGAGGVGGGKGGDGAAVQGAPAEGGGGPGGGRAGATSGGGGGFAVPGSPGRSGSGFTGGAGGPAVGDATLSPLVGGSGGAGGAAAIYTYNGDMSGPGGGGGGGALRVVAGGDVVLRGRILADGGAGGGHRRSPPRQGAGAGGGSGGAVLVQTHREVRFEGGFISARGGLGGDGTYNAQAATHRRFGGNGAPGRVRLEDGDGQVPGIEGNVHPAPSTARVTALVPPAAGVGPNFTAPAGTTVLDTTPGPMFLASLTIPANATVRVVGPNPFEVICAGDITIEGTLDASGEAGEDSTGTSSLAARGGRGGAGGARGGDGGLVARPGEAGHGPGGGAANVATSGLSFTGSGGGFGAPGQRGNAVNGVIPPAGAVYGDERLATLQGGSGGAGASGSSYANSAAGGGGGGAVRLHARGTVRISGQVVADGGPGGVQGTFGNTTFAGPGSGGSGGAILIQARRISLEGGRLSARGGRGGEVPNVSGGPFYREADEAAFYHGAHGGAGRVRLEALEVPLGAVDLVSFSGDQGDYFLTFAAGTLSRAAYVPAQPLGTTAQSRWYAAGGPAPSYGLPNVVGAAPGGGSPVTALEWQGADDDGQGRPDLATLTAWSPDPTTTCRGKAHVRFRLTLAPGAEVDRVELPVWP